MKYSYLKKYFLVFFVLFNFNSYSQSLDKEDALKIAAQAANVEIPQKFNYQSVIRASDGSVLKSKKIGIRFSILKNSNNGEAVYTESHSTYTNKNGLISLAIGTGNSQGSIATIDWSSGQYYLKTQIDPVGGINYLMDDTSQLLSVPYALYSGSSPSSEKEILLFGENYLSYSESELTLEKIDLSSNVKGTLPVSSGGTGLKKSPMIGLIAANDAAGARTILGVDAAGKDNSTPVSLIEVNNSYLSLNGQEILARTVPVTLGGTGSNTAPMVGVITAADAAAARTILGVESSDPITLETVTDNYLTLTGQKITASTVPVTLGGTGSNAAPMVGVITAADAAAARTVLGVADSESVTLETVTDNYLTLTGQKITASTVPVTLGGTGSNTAPMVGVITAADAAAARTVLGVADSESVTLETVTDNYLTLTGQKITASTVPVTLGGTGSATAPMVGVITAADAAAARTAIGAGTMAVQNKGTVDIDGGAIDGTAIGASAPAIGTFTSVNSGIIQSVGDTDIVIKTGNETTGTLTITDGENGNINISPNGTGKVVLDNLTFPSSDGSANQILKTDGSGTLGWIDNTVAINPGGDGIEVGDGSGGGTVESKGDHDLTIKTGNATSGDITIINGANGDIKLNPNGTGKVAVSSDLAINTNKFTVLAASGNIGTAGTLNVAGNSTLVGALSVTGNIGTSGTLGVTGASTLSGALNVTGATTLTGALNVSGASSVTGATTIIGDLSVGGSNQELRFYEGSNYVGFEAPALAADKIWVLPNVDGSADQVLKTDGSGNLGWTAAGGGGAIDGLSDAKLEGTDFTGSMIIGHRTTGTLDAAEKNTAVGISSLDAITTGDENTAIGNNSLTYNTTGVTNTASGYASLQFNTTGNSNTASGAIALKANTTGSNNTASGYASLQQNTTGSRNTVSGVASLQNNTTGGTNTASGSGSLQQNTTGNSNTALGDQAGDVITTGSNNVLIGKDADPSANNATNQIVIGQGATGTTDNTVLLGNGSITNWLPTDTNEVDLGSSTKEMKDIYVDGVAYTDAIGFGTVAMTLPTADGSANQVLKTDGSGNLGWTAAGGGGAIDGLSDAKLEGTDFTGSMILGHQTTGTLDAAEKNTASWNRLIRCNNIWRQKYGNRIQCFDSEYNRRKEYCFWGLFFV